MNLEEKKQIVSSYNEIFVESAIVIVFKNLGLTVEEMTELRVKSSDLGASIKVTKNSLAKIALKDTDCSGLNDNFTGPTAVAYSSDPVAAAKGLVEFAKDNPKVEILSGSLNGEDINGGDITILAKLPSLDELRAKIICTINAPLIKIAGVTQAPAGQLARLLSAYSQKS